MLRGMETHKPSESVQEQGVKALDNLCADEADQESLVRAGGVKVCFINHNSHKFLVK